MDEDITVMIEPQLNPNEKKHILVTHDEFVFYANNGKKTYWGPKDHAFLRKKGNRLSLHISDFLTEIDGRLKFENKEACVIIKPGNSRNGWWTNENLVKQECYITLFYFFFENFSIFYYFNGQYYFICNR